MNRELTECTQPQAVLAEITARLEAISQRQHALAAERTVLTRAATRIRLGAHPDVVLAEVHAARGREALGGR